jgi:hypothetical protein
MADYEAAVRLNPKEPAGLAYLARLQAVCDDEGVRNSASAIPTAKKACELTEYCESQYLAVLGAAQAADGNFG